MNEWGIKDEWNFYINKKAPVIIQEEELGSLRQWSIDVKETLNDPQGPMTVNVVESLSQAIDFCKENDLKYDVVYLNQLN